MAQALLRCAPKRHAATDATDAPPPPLLVLGIAGYVRDDTGGGGGCWPCKPSGAVHYILDVRVGSDHFRVLRRFSDFRALHGLVARWLGLERPFFLPRLLRHPAAALERRTFMLQGYLDDLVARAAIAPASSDDGAPLVLAGFLGLDAATASRALVLGCPEEPVLQPLQVWHGNGLGESPNLQSWGNGPILSQKELKTQLALSGVSSSASSAVTTSTTGTATAPDTAAPSPSFSPAPLALWSAPLARPRPFATPAVPAGHGRILPATRATPGSSSELNGARAAWWHPLAVWVLRKLTGGVAVLTPGGEMRVDRVTLEAALLEWAVGKMLCGMPLPMKVASARVDSVIVTLKNGDLQVVANKLRLVLTDQPDGDGLPQSFEEREARAARVIGEVYAAVGRSTAANAKAVNAEAASAHAKAANAEAARAKAANVEAVNANVKAANAEADIAKARAANSSANAAAVNPNTAGASAHAASASGRGATNGEIINGLGALHELGASTGAESNGSNGAVHVHTEKGDTNGLPQFERTAGFARVSRPVLPIAPPPTARTSTWLLSPTGMSFQPGSLRRPTRQAAAPRGWRESAEAQRRAKEERARGGGTGGGGNVEVGGGGGGGGGGVGASGSRGGGGGARATSERAFPHAPGLSLAADARTPAGSKGTEESDTRSGASAAASAGAEGGAGAGGAAGARGAGGGAWGTTVRELAALLTLRSQAQRLGDAETFEPPPPPSGGGATPVHDELRRMPSILRRRLLAFACRVLPRVRVKTIELCYEHLGLAMSIPLDATAAELALLWLLLAFPSAPRLMGLCKPAGAGNGQRA